MLNPAIAKALNEQICKEFYSGYLYLHMADYYEEEGLSGFENWFFVQAQEERDHALLLRAYLHNNDTEVVLMPIEAPAYHFVNFGDPLDLTLSHEQTVTASINAIYAKAVEAHDFRTMQFLDWFIQEQSEEEKNAADLIKWFRLFGNDSKGLFELDQKLAARVYTAPSLVLE